MLKVGDKVKLSEEWCRIFRFAAKGLARTGSVVALRKSKVDHKEVAIGVARDGSGKSKNGKPLFYKPGIWEKC